jgi:hypothetical protein
MAGAAFGRTRTKGPRHGPFVDMRIASETDASKLASRGLIRERAGGQGQDSPARRLLCAEEDADLARGGLRRVRAMHDVGVQQ